MNSGRNILNKLHEAKEQRSMTYKGFTITVDYDNIFHVYSSKGHIAEFENAEEAQNYIDDMSLPVRKPTIRASSNERNFLVYKKGTRNHFRAMYYLRKYRSCRYCNEVQADRFTEEEAKKLVSNSNNQYDMYRI